MAISDHESGKITIVDAKGDSSESPTVLEKLHSKPVQLIAYSAEFSIAISIDEIGMIEYWSGAKNNYDFPKNLTWEYKTDTDLYVLLKESLKPICLKISPNGKTFALVAHDKTIFIFNLKTAKIIKRLDETYQHYVNEGKETK